MLSNKASRYLATFYPFCAKSLQSRAKRVRFAVAGADSFSTARDDDDGSQNGAVDLAYTVYDEDTAGRHPIVVTHGLFGSRNNWHSLAKALNRTTARKVVTVDLRCHGDSPHHPHVNYDVMSDDLVKLVTKELRLSKVAFVGHSMGGAVALTTALKSPRLAECVVSVDISLEPIPRTDEPLSYLDRMLNITWDPTRPLSAVRKLVESELEDTVPDVSVRRWLATNLSTDAEGRVRWRLDLRSLRNNFPFLYETSVAQGVYPGPTLYVAGGSSNYVRPHQHEAIRERFPRARFESVPDAGHWVHTEKPNEFLDIVTKFLNETRL